MSASHLKIVASTDARLLHGNHSCHERRPLSLPHDLNLSDEHMGHVHRFLGLGPFDRKHYETMRGMRLWYFANRKAMQERDAELKAAQRAAEK